MVTVGSQLTLCPTPNTGVRLLPSVATLGPTFTRTVAPRSGVTSSVYILALTAVNVPFVPPTTLTSPMSNSMTSALKVNVIVMGSVLVICPGPSTSIVSIGTLASQTDVIETADTGPEFDSASVAEFASTLTTTSFSPTGRTCSAKLLRLSPPSHLSFEAPVTVTSSIVNPLTLRSNVRCTTKAARELIFGGILRIVTEGASVSHSPHSPTGDTEPRSIPPMTEFAATVISTSILPMEIIPSVSSSPLPNNVPPSLPPRVLISPPAVTMDCGISTWAATGDAATTTNRNSTRDSRISTPLKQPTPTPPLLLCTSYTVPFKNWFYRNLCVERLNLVPLKDRD